MIHKLAHSKYDLAFFVMNFELNKLEQNQMWVSYVKFENLSKMRQLQWLAIDNEGYSKVTRLM